MHTFLLLAHAIPQTVDPKFDEVEQRLLSLEALLQTMVRDISELAGGNVMQVCV